MLLRLPLLWLLLLLAPGRPLLAQPTNWRSIALDSVATLAFPDSVSQRQEKGLRIYSCVAEATVYMAMSQPTNRFVELVSNRPEFYDGMVQQWLKETDGKLLRRRPIRVGAFKGVEIEFTTPENKKLPATKFTRMVTVNSTVYFLNCWTNADPATALAERTRFFNSFQVQARPALQHDAYQLGQLLGRLAAYAVLLLVAIGLVVGGMLLLRRRAGRA